VRVLVYCGAPGIPICGPSGSSAHLRGIARALGRAGHDVRVATPLFCDHRGAFDVPLGLPHIGFRPRSWRWLGPLRERGETWDSRRLATIATGQWTPDLIWERHALFADGARAVAKRRKIHRLVELNAPLAIERARYGRVRDAGYAERMEQRDLESADRVIAVSAWLADWARNRGCQDVHHVPNGVEAGIGDRAIGREGLNGLVIGFLGTNKPWHGIGRIPGILDHLPEATALLIGEGPVEVPQHPRIRSVGRTRPADLAHQIAAMDVGLVPYTDDAPPWFCPLKILAYRAQGVPVVARDIGDCRMLIGDGGEVLDTDDPDAWAAAIRRQATRERVPWTRTWDDVVAEALDGLVS